MKEGQRGIVDKLVKEFKGSIVERARYEADIISMCSSNPTIYLRTIIDISYEAACYYISMMNILNCCEDDWKIPNDYENDKIHNLDTIKYVLSCEGEVDGVSFMQEDLKMLAKVRPEFFVWFFCNSSHNIAGIMHAMLEGVRVL